MCYYTESGPPNINSARNEEKMLNKIGSDVPKKQKRQKFEIFLKKNI